MTYSYKQIWSVAFPVMLSVLTEQLINITDAAFLGRVGETELGAAAIAGIYYLAVYMLGFGFSIGLQVMISQRNGEGKHGDIGKVFFQGFYVLLALAVFLFVFTRAGSPYLLQRLIASDEVYRAVMDYLDERSFGLLFAFPLLAFRAFFVGTTHTRILSVSAVVMIVSNIALNYLLIFGKGGFQPMGIAGAGIASAVSEALALIVILMFALVRVDKRFYNLVPVWDWQTMKALFHLSVWSMLQSFIGVAPWLLFFVAIEHLGKSELAIANMVRSVSIVFFVIVSSLSATAGSFVGNLVGAGKKEEVMPLCRRVITFGYILGVPLMVLALVFNKIVLAVYTPDKVLITDAFWPYVVMLSNFFFVLPAYVYNHAVLGTGNTKKAFVFQLITLVCYLVYLGFLSFFTHAPLAVYWTVEHLFVILLFVFSFWFMKKGKW